MSVATYIDISIASEAPTTKSSRLPGKKIFYCTHPDCGKAFTLNKQMVKHSQIHARKLTNTQAITNIFSTENPIKEMIPESLNLASEILQDSQEINTTVV